MQGISGILIKKSQESRTKILGSDLPLTRSSVRSDHLYKMTSTHEFSSFCHIETVTKETPPPPPHARKTSPWRHSFERGEGRCVPPLNLINRFLFHRSYIILITLYRVLFYVPRCRHYFY